MNQHRRIFMVPGPVEPPAYVMEAISRPVMHQRSQDFREFFLDFQEHLQYAFQTQHPVLCLNGSGTFATELAMHSIFRPGDQVAIPAMGKFSERWAAYAMEIGLDPVPVGITWGHEFTMDHLRQVQEEYPRLTGWILTHCETSTGVGIDLEEIASAIRAANPAALILVDAVSTLAAQPFYTDGWDLDMVVTASQKGFLNPAGTAYISVGPRAQARLVRNPAESYFDLSQYLDALERGDYPFTPPAQMFYGVHAALKHIKAEGLPAIWNRTHTLSRTCKAGLRALGIELFGAANADALTAFSLGRADHTAFRKALLDKHHIELAAGQGRLADLIIRIGHFGNHGMPELRQCLDAIQDILPAFKQ